MNLRPTVTCALAILLVARGASAETKAECSSANCDYRFDDEDVNSPGYSAYGDWFKVRPPAPRAMLIRPRTSFVMELVKSANGV